MSMTEEYDVVIIGGGHNGLIVGCYLARAGQNVCVVEKQDMVGGGVVTREVTIPGFKHDLAAVSHTFIQRNPLIEQDELNLQSKYGLKYVPIDPVQSILFSDDRALIQAILQDCATNIKGRWNGFLLPSPILRQVAFISGC
jgi:phytoene dehydrogenase-like protein